MKNLNYYEKSALRTKSISESKFGFSVALDEKSEKDVIYSGETDYIIRTYNVFSKDGAIIFKSNIRGYYENDKDWITVFDGPYRQDDSTFAMRALQGEERFDEDLYKFIIESIIETPEILDHLPHEFVAMNKDFPEKLFNTYFEKEYRLYVDKKGLAQVLDDALEVAKENIGTWTAAFERHQVAVDVNELANSGTWRINEDKANYNQFRNTVLGMEKD